MDTKLEVLIVLGGGLFRESNGIWRTTNFNETGDEYGELGDRLRVVAASYLSKEHPRLKLIVSGGKGQLIEIPGCPTLSAVLKKELIELSISSENIIEENTAYNTYRQLKNSLAIIRKLNLSQVGIISNEYHLPRVGAFLEYIPRTNIYVELLSAENILINKAPEDWKQYIQNAYASEAMKKRIALEQSGIKDLREGRYKFS
jgi:hypothetical protein